MISPPVTGDSLDARSLTNVPHFIADERGFRTSLLAAGNTAHDQGLGKIVAKEDLDPDAVLVLVKRLAVRKSDERSHGRPRAPDPGG